MVRYPVESFQLRVAKEPRTEPRMTGLVSVSSTDLVPHRGVTDIFTYDPPPRYVIARTD